MPNQWKLGDPCYIADINIAPGNMRFRVMPARVVHIAGITGKTATAQSSNLRPEPWGRWEPFTKGAPFASKLAALVHVCQEMRKNSISVSAPLIKFEGTPPEMK